MKLRTKKVKKTLTKGEIAEWVDPESSSDIENPILEMSFRCSSTDTSDEDNLPI